MSPAVLKVSVSEDDAGRSRTNKTVSGRMLGGGDGGRTGATPLRGSFLCVRLCVLAHARAPACVCVCV